MVIYPDTEDAKKEVMKYAKNILFYSLQKESGEFIAYKATEDINNIEELWKHNFNEENEMVINIKESVIESIPRREEVLIAGKSFKKYAKKLIFLATAELQHERINIQLMDSETGKSLFKKKISGSYPTKFPILEVYENAAVIGMIFEELKSDKLFMIEAVLSPEIADTHNTDEVKKSNIEDLLYPTLTELEINWKLKGVKFIQVEGIEYLVAIDGDNKLRIIETSKLELGISNKITEENIKEIQLPKNLKFKDPVNFEYDPKTKNLIVFGLDVYSFHFPK